jgi:hypothetical protein
MYRLDDRLGQPKTIVTPAWYPDSELVTTAFTSRLTALFETNRGRMTCDLLGHGHDGLNERK